VFKWYADRERELSAAKNWSVQNAGLSIKQTEIRQCSSSKNIKSSPESLTRQRKLLLLLNVFYALLFNIQIVNVAKLSVEGWEP